MANMSSHTRVPGPRSLLNRALLLGVTPQWDSSKLSKSSSLRLLRMSSCRRVHGTFRMACGIAGLAAAEADSKVCSALTQALRSPRPAPFQYDYEREERRGRPSILYGIGELCGAPCVGDEKLRWPRVRLRHQVEQAAGKGGTDGPNKVIHALLDGPVGFQGAGVDQGPQEGKRDAAFCDVSGRAGLRKQQAASGL